MQRKNIYILRNSSKKISMPTHMIFQEYHLGISKPQYSQLWAPYTSFHWNFVKHNLQTKFSQNFHITKFEI